LEGLHRANPNAGGVSEAQLMRALPLRVRPAAFAHVLGVLVRSGEIVRAGAVLQRRGFAATLSAADDTLWQRIEALMEAAPDRPPTIHEIAEELGLPQNAVAGLLGRTAKLGLTARVSSNRYMTRQGLRALADIAERGASGLPGGRFSVAAYRDWSGIGRNLSIEILEYFDKVRFTRRLGNEREILRPAAEVFGPGEDATASEAPPKEPAQAG
jgi:selenocysteine-specific elongation factor